MARQQVKAATSKLASLTIMTVKLVYVTAAIEVEADAFASERLE